MTRDLLYKPQAPLVVPEDQDDGKKRVQPTDKMGLPIRSRDIGGVEESKAPGPADGANAKPDDVGADGATPAAKAPRAFLASYFNKDIAATAQVNQRAGRMKALRGSEEATDLKKIVLPPNEMNGVDPTQLRGASDLMGLEAPPTLEQLLQRQGSWVRAPQVTVDMIMQRMAQLQQMVALRVAVLARMTRLPQDRVARSVTLSHAAQAASEDGSDPEAEEATDILDEGGSLARHTSRQARGMHERIARALGLRLHDLDEK